MRRALRRSAVASAVAVAVIGLVSSQASAHVTIETLGEVVPGGESGTIGFNVPNERDDAGTVAVEVQMPTEHPLAFVSVQPKPGWTVETTTRTLDEPLEAFGTTFDEAVDTVTWTATGDTQIGPGQFDQFWVSAGPIPDDADALEFPVLQTYDDGEIVRWIEPTPAGGEEPEHPVPTLSFTGEDDHAAADDEATASDGEAAADQAAADQAAADQATAADDDDGGDGDGTVLAVIALVVGGLGLIAGVVGLATARRSRA